jgi:menaquinone-dependent protoporphyrinogen oxidase
MSNLVLAGYATRYGSTIEVIKAIGSSLQEDGFQVDIKPLREIRNIDVYNAVIIGAPLFMFRWHRDALNFLSKHKKTLEKLPVAVFALGPTHDPYDSEEWKSSNSQLNNELDKFEWFKPVSVKMFGGKYDPDKLRFPLKLFAGKVPASNIIDWKDINTWAKSLPAMFGSGVD